MEETPTAAVLEQVKELHDTFYTEVDRLLAEAKILGSTASEKQQLLDKAERLRKLGFTATKEVSVAKKEEDRLAIITKENVNKIELNNAIKYFSEKYPQYKFITEESVKKICAKYGLVYGDSSKYIGTVPDRAIIQIEQFKIDEEDYCYFFQVETIYSSFGKKFLSFKDGELEKKSYSGNSYWTYLEKCPMEIAAPIKDFNMSESEVKDFKINKVELPDPVVLQPVIFKNKKYYLIVTAWGDEAGDSLVVNANHN